MSSYWLGLVTIPAIIAIAAALLFLGTLAVRWTRQWWLGPVDFHSKDWGPRTRHASCVLAARRMWAFKLPGSRLLVFRSTVGGTDYKYGRYYTDTNDIARRARAVLLDEFDPR